MPSSLNPPCADMLPEAYHGPHAAVMCSATPDGTVGPHISGRLASSARRTTGCKPGARSGAGQAALITWTTPDRRPS